MSNIQRWELTLETDVRHAIYKTYQVVDQKGDIVAEADVLFNPRTRKCEINEISSHIPNKSYGSQLINAIVADANVYDLTLVTLDSVDDAIGFYLKMGFVIAYRYNQTDLTLMVLEL